MTTTNQPNDTAARPADAWRRKRDFWAKVVISMGLPHLLLVPLQFAVEDPAWSAVILAFSLTTFFVQMAAVVRWRICSRRAAVEGLMRRIGVSS